MTSVNIRVAGLAALVAATLLGACSAQQLYATGREWQKNECRKIPDAAERQRCLESNARSYEDYKAEADKARVK
jgi:hypothetical protein